MTVTIADVLTDLARQLEAENDVDAVLQRVVETSVSQIEGAEHAGVTIVSRRPFTTPAATSVLVHEVDERQYSLGEGPCLTAALQPEPIVRADDLSSDERWPDFAEAAVALGVRSMLSFQLYTDTDTIGSLNIYASDVGAFTDESVHTGVLLAAHAALAAARTAKTANLLAAIDSRDTIGQAKGILMERHRITPDGAFALLIAASQSSRLRLSDIAANLTETGELTSSPIAAP